MALDTQVVELLGRMGTTTFLEEEAPSMAEWLTAIGTFLVCVLAIWGDWLKAHFFHPKLTLVVPDAPPVRIPIDPPRYYLHLRVLNDGNATARLGNSREFRRNSGKGIQGRNSEEFRGHNT